MAETLAQKPTALDKLLNVSHFPHGEQAGTKRISTTSVNSKDMIMYLPKYLTKWTLAE